MALINEGGFKKEVYYKSYTYSDLFNCCAKIIIDMRHNNYFQQNNIDISSLKERIQVIIKEFNINVDNPVEVLEICKIFE